jgi:hypothetical protein
MSQARRSTAAASVGAHPEGNRDGPVSRVRRRGFRDVPVARGALEHEQPGEHARRVGERAARGPDAEARTAGAGRRGGGAAWRTERLKLFRLALFK